MPGRGAYAKGVAKRAEILEAALEIIARNGYSGATVRELADAVGLSQNGLLHYFGSKDALFVEILRRRDEVDQATYVDERPPSSDVVTDLMEFLRHNSEVPGLVQLYSRLSNEASEPSHPSHEYFRERYEVVRHAQTKAVAALQEQGRLPDDVDPDKLAVILAALADGLQTQWMYDQSIDMSESIGYLFQLLGVRAAK